MSRTQRGAEHDTWGLRWFVPLVLIALLITCIVPRSQARAEQVRVDETKANETKANETKANETKTQVDDTVGSGAARGLPRYIALGSLGAPLRLTLEEELGQDRLGPPFADLLFGYSFGADAKWRHGLGLGVSWNLGGDGAYVEPIYALEQLVVMPAYVGIMDVARDVPLIAHLGLPILVAGGSSFGVEIGAALAYRVLAGTGVFVELDVSGFAGALAAMHVLASLEVGIVLEYEVLP
jgi:hypothetical protein